MVVISKCVRKRYLGVNRSLNISSSFPCRVFVFPPCRTCCCLFHLVLCALGALGALGGCCCYWVQAS